MARNYVALPYEYRQEMEVLSDAEFGRLCRALLEYSELGRTIVLNGNERFFANRVMRQEDRFRESYSGTSEARSEAGKKGAAKRWDGKNGKAILLMATDSKNGYTETETKTETKERKETTLTGGKEKTPLAAALDDFAEFRKKIRKPLTDKARELTLSELEKLAPGDEQMQIAILNQSIQRGWQGVFPLKTEPRKSQGNIPDYDSMEDLP